MKILDKVFLVGGADYRLSSGCNVYLIDAGGDLFLMDIGGNADVEDVLRNVREEGFDPGDVSALFVTHEHGDHGGGAKRAKEGFKEVYTKSLRKLTEESHPEALFPGHGCFVLREGTDALREAIEAILAVGLRT